MQGHIFLVGFMGSGKSTVGPIVANRLSRRFIDIDSLVVAQAGKSIADIFIDNSEAEFRRLETEALKSCSTFAPAVIAVGGGGFVSTENHRLVSETGISVWLNCPLEICISRVRGDHTRPLARNDSQLTALFETRVDHYRKAAYEVRTANRPPEEIVAEILKLTSIG